jgi:hypothetical protein
MSGVLPSANCCSIEDCAANAASLPSYTTSFPCSSSDNRGCLVLGSIFYKDEVYLVLVNLPIIRPIMDVLRLICVFSVRVCSHCEMIVVSICCNNEN